MDKFIKSPTSTPPTSPLTSPLNSPSPINSPNLSAESKKILDFLINCANQDKLISENLLHNKNKIEIENRENKDNSNQSKRLEPKISENKMTKTIDTNSIENKDFVENKIIKCNKKKKKKNRCYICNKKLTLLPIICKCGFKFCNSHRHPEDHQCTFDHKHQQQKLLRDKNPQIISDKITKI